MKSSRTAIQTGRTPNAPGPGVVFLSLAVDAALVIIFAAIGRGSHARAATITGLGETAWPFLAGLAVMWLVTLAWRHPLRVVRTGIPLWVGTVALGMLLRALSGQGTALPFVIVATLTLALLLVGWRVLAVLTRKVRSMQKARQLEPNQAP